MKWNEIILSKVTNSILSISIVIDNDNILNDESILNDISKDNYEILEMVDLEETRLSIEKKKFNNNGKKLLIICKKYKKEEIPYDFQRDWDLIELKLQNLFEGLNYNILKNIDSSLYRELYNRFPEKDNGVLGETSTINFILKKIYNIDLLEIDTEMDLLSKLLDLYINNKDIDKYTSKYVLKKINKNLLPTVPFKNLIEDKQFFWDYMQDQWRLFIDDKINNTSKSSVDFSYANIKIKLPYVFYEGHIQPLNIEKTDNIDNVFRVGVDKSKDFDNKKVESIIDKIELIESKKEVRYNDWIEIAENISNLEYICDINKTGIASSLKCKLSDIEYRTEEIFKTWLLSNYGSLSNLSYIKKPIMVHHIPKYMAYKRAEKSKVALIVIDGLALNQWQVIKEYINNSIDNIKIKSNSVFAWIPTITSISRQAIFSGKIPSQFSNSIYTTSKEDYYWKLFWQEEGFKLSNIKYKKGLGKDDIGETLDIIKNSKVNTIGLVIDIVDKIMHGQQLGNKGMIQNIRAWMENGYLRNLLEVLLSYGYSIYLTSDHGNIEARGIGKPKQGSLSETKGQRTRIYSNKLLVSDIEDKYESILWPGYGLPEDMYVCVPKENRAYIKKNDEIISHGGISIKEVIVPFIEIWKDEK